MILAGKHRKTPIIVIIVRYTKGSKRWENLRDVYLEVSQRRWVYDTHGEVAGGTPPLARPGSRACLLQIMAVLACGYPVDNQPARCGSTLRVNCPSIGQFPRDSEALAGPPGESCMRQRCGNHAIDLHNPLMKHTPDLNLPRLPRFTFVLPILTSLPHGRSEPLSLPFRRMLVGLCPFRACRASRTLCATRGRRPSACAGCRRWGGRRPGCPGRPGRPRGRSCRPDRRQDERPPARRGAPGREPPNDVHRRARPAALLDGGSVGPASAVLHVAGREGDAAAGSAGDGQRGGHSGGPQCPSPSGWRRTTAPQAPWASPPCRPSTPMLRVNARSRRPQRVITCRGCTTSQSPVT